MVGFCLSVFSIYAEWFMAGIDFINRIAPHSYYLIPNYPCYCYLIPLSGLDGKKIENFRDDRGNTVLHIAAWKDRFSICEFLCSDEGGKLNPNARDGKGWTPLQVKKGFKKV